MLQKDADSVSNVVDPDETQPVLDLHCSSSEG